MFQQSQLLFAYAVSPVHMGAGQAIGVIDNPIQRERHTAHPMLAGSGLKGALRHHLEVSWPDKDTVTRLFGPESGAPDHAGAVSFGDAQLVAFPVRSLQQAFVYAVSPVTLARLKRLAGVAGLATGWEIPAVADDHCLIADARVADGEKLILEAYEFSAEQDATVKTIAAWLAATALPPDPAHDYFRAKLKTDLVLLPDDAFSHFVNNACVVEAHVRIDNDSGTAADGGLFYTENLPPEALLAAPVFASQERRKTNGENGPAWLAERVMAQIVTGDEGRPGLNNALIQAGGDATTGRGQIVLHFAAGDDHAHG